MEIISYTLGIESQVVSNVHFLSFMLGAVSQMRRGARLATRSDRNTHSLPTLRRTVCMVHGLRRDFSGMEEEKGKKSEEFGWMPIPNTWTRRVNSLRNRIGQTLCHSSLTSLTARHVAEAATIKGAVGLSQTASRKSELGHANPIRSYDIGLSYFIIHPKLVLLPKPTPRNPSTLRPSAHHSLKRTASDDTGLAGDVTLGGSLLRSSSNAALARNLGSLAVDGALPVGVAGAGTLSIGAGQALELGLRLALALSDIGIVVGVVVGVVVVVVIVVVRGIIVLRGIVVVILCRVFSLLLCCVVLLLGRVFGLLLRSSSCFLLRSILLLRGSGSTVLLLLRCLCLRRRGSLSLGSYFAHSLLLPGSGLEMGGVVCHGAFGADLDR